VVKEVLRSKSGMLGVSILSFLVILSLFVPLYFPQRDVVKAWNDPLHWIRYPRLAAPEWYEIFAGKKLPRNIFLEDNCFKQISLRMVSNFKYVKRMAAFNYTYDDFPSDFVIFINSHYSKSPPYVAVEFIRPDGDKVKLFSGSLNSPNETLYVSTDMDILGKISDYVAKACGKPPREPNFIYLFARKEGSATLERPRVLKSDSFSLVRPYKILISTLFYDKNDTLKVEAVIYGKVYGLAGTDDKRRDILLGVLWGTPVSLAFGLIGAVITVMFQAMIGSLSAWYGGKVDEVVQRVTDTFMVLPFLPILITISFIYRLSIWTLLEVVVLLSLFGSITKTARSMALQIKAEQYIEAAISYGASKRRVLIFYILPRVLPYAFANMVITVPAYIFLEAALSLLGLGDPVLPTLGKLLDNAYEGGALYHGYWWWILIPAGVILLITIAFVLIYYPLDKILNPRLRER